MAAAKAFNALTHQKQRAESEAAKKIEKRFGAKLRKAEREATRTKAAVDRATARLIAITRAEGRDLDGTLVPGKRKR